MVKTDANVSKIKVEQKANRVHLKKGSISKENIRLEFLHSNSKKTKKKDLSNSKSRAYYINKLRNQSKNASTPIKSASNGDLARRKKAQKNNR